jgi:hypothetical protein
LVAGSQPTVSVEEAILLSDRIVPMTRGPRARLGDAVDVALPKPRTVSQLLHDEEAERVRAYVIESLTDSVHRSAGLTREARPTSTDVADAARFPAVASVVPAENE